jgi:inner membrane protein
MTHAAAGLALAELFAPRPMPWPFYALAASLGAAPDLDAIGFMLGVHYRSRFGHRGFSHSLCCALLVGVPLALLTSVPFGVPWWSLAAFYFAVLVSHGLLDAVTNGGLGVAFFSPLDDRRYFLPWRPIQVSPIGAAFFSRWGLRALASEVVWVWLPLAVLVGAAELWRRSAPTLAGTTGLPPAAVFATLPPAAPLLARSKCLFARDFPLTLPPGHGTRGGALRRVVAGPEVPSE